MRFLTFFSNSYLLLHLTWTLSSFSLLATAQPKNPCSGFLSTPAQVRQTIDQLVVDAVKDRPEIDILAKDWLSELAAQRPDVAEKLGVQVNTAHLEPNQEQIRLARDIIIHGRAFIEEVYSIGPIKILRYLNQEGEFFHVYVRPSKMKSLQGTEIEFILYIDSNTGAIDANGSTGLELLKHLFEVQNSYTGFIFIDLNFLGEVNYFTDGYLAGNQYLSILGKVIRENLRSTDLLFKLGGDEFGIVLPNIALLQSPDSDLFPDLPSNSPHSSTPETGPLESLLNRLVFAIQESREARSIFVREKRIAGNYYWAIHKAQNISDLDQTLINKLTPEARKFAQEDFLEFKKQILSNLIDRRWQLSVLRPSISLAGVIASPGTSFAKIRATAENEGSQVKIGFKNQIGLSTNKYTWNNPIPPDSHAPTSSSRRTERRRNRMTRPLPRKPVVLSGGLGDTSGP